MPDPERPGSERVKVYVEPDPDYDGDLAPGDVVEYLDSRVARDADPAEVEVVENVPQTDTGKTDEKALRERNDADGETAE